MFSIHKKLEAGFKKVILKNDITGNYAAVIPSCSGMLHEFVAMQDGTSTNVIESYGSFDEFRDHLALKGFAGCKLSPFVCRLQNGKYTFGEKEYSVQKSLPSKHALHGLLYDKEFIVITETANELNASITMKYEYRADDPGCVF